MVERTLVLAKPDAVARGLVGEIIGRLERRGLRLSGLKMIWVDEDLAKKHYAAHRGKPFFDGLVEYITALPVVAMVWEGPSAISVVRQVMGSTDPAKAQPGTIRGDLALDISNNLVHGSDSEESARREISLFFREDEIFSWSRPQERFISGQ
ncbi:MAG TPA: nucleoside-diphosphate kinase [Firmicutes bacterium]|uniref:Nucleoside diphosphate kinase n=1 Tax=Candidatus Fermentithermobacillus carboniphilus TaxID=3085328 RepID=A0AAT9LF27_9FIRM|nr:MAG: nucleoside-diphosphate kinase [Candidatus Fermentithermobacillus carboniphilus]HHW17564.1 nucleoside-diphosphate kinase [Candidatus Fermentithermobacillaceae bacterium]